MTKLENFNQKTMSSREIAELTNKRHDNVLRDCDTLNEYYDKMSLLKIEETYYTADNKQQYREYLLTKIQCFDLMTGYNIELRIKVNRRWEELESKPQIDFTNPDTVMVLVQNWKEEQEKRTLLEKENAKLKPKAELMDKVLDTGEKIDVGQAAKILRLPYGRNSLFKNLRDMGIFFKNRNEPKQEYIDRGYFELKEKWIDRNNHDGFMIVKVLVTQRGLEYLNKILMGNKSDGKQLNIA